VHWDAEGGSRTALVYVRLERSCATLTWSRPGWSGLRTGTGGSGSFPDYRCLRCLLICQILLKVSLTYILTVSGT